jgi:hypothetical protein
LLGQLWSKFAAKYQFKSFFSRSVTGHVIETFVLSPFGCLKVKLPTQDRPYLHLATSFLPALKFGHKSSLLETAQRQFSSLHLHHNKA